jgi:hypothetical protein
MLTLVGLDRFDFKSMLSVATAPLVLQLDMRGAERPAAVINRLLDDLAELALRRWPDWREPPASQSAAFRLNWRRAAMRFAAAGRPPRFRRLSAEAEFAHLMSTQEPLVLLGEVDPVDAVRAGRAIATLEWCRRQRAAVVALLPTPPAPTNPWDRLLFGAETFKVPDGVDQRVLGGRFGGSAVERRLRHALGESCDLAGLFESEVTLQLGALGLRPRVDLLWREGGIVVELDGPEHARDPRYAADRHRDYELLVAGYLVLRLTNDEIELDLTRALEKIRRVVQLRRPH